MTAGDVSKKTAAANKAFRSASGLDWKDGTDAEASRRGFIACLDEQVIKDGDGRAVWDLTQYSFLDGEEAPATVNPSLWRQARLNMSAGLFKVADHIYQVRGHDLSVISFIEGAKGWVVIDPLVSTVIQRRRTTGPSSPGWKRREV